MFAGVRGDWQVVEVPYASGSPATGGLYRVLGEGFSVFVKLLWHLRHWPRLGMLPEHIRDEFAAEFPWRQELDMWQPPFAARLPRGLRVPELYGITDLGDDRLLLWMEDVDADETCWDIEKFALAARLLGGLAALSASPQLFATTYLPPGAGLRMYVGGRVNLGAVPALHDDALWRHPLLAEAADPDLRQDLLRLASELPSILDSLDTLPQAVPHGDASPQNLLVPRGSADELVAIDISFQSPMAVGFDLGQLLIGLVHAGQMPAAKLAEVHEVLVPSFVDGLKEHGLDVPAEQVEQGYLGCLLARAGFTSLPFELIGQPVTAELEALFRERTVLTRFIVDKWAQAKYN